MTSDISPQPISPLRARMIEDMSVRGFKQDTRRDYVRHVRAFAAFIGRSPDTATAEELRLFQLHQTQSGLRPPSRGPQSETAPRDRPGTGRHAAAGKHPLEGKADDDQDVILGQQVDEGHRNAERGRDHDRRTACYSLYARARA